MFSYISKCCNCLVEFSPFFLNRFSSITIFYLMLRLYFTTSFHQNIEQYFINPPYIIFSIYPTTFISISNNIYLYLLQHFIRISYNIYRYIIQHDVNVSYKSSIYHISYNIVVLHSTQFSRYILQHFIKIP